MKGSGLSVVDRSLIYFRASVCAGSFNGKRGLCSPVSGEKSYFLSNKLSHLSATNCVQIIFSRSFLYIRVVFCLILVSSVIFTLGLSNVLCMSRFVCSGVHHITEIVRIYTYVGSACVVS